MAFDGNIDLNECLKNHGHNFTNSADMSCDSGKSDFDEEYYANRPPPIDIKEYEAQMKKLPTFKIPDNKTKKKKTRSRRYRNNRDFNGETYEKKYNTKPRTNEYYNKNEDNTPNLHKIPSMDFFSQNSAHNTNQNKHNYNQPLNYDNPNKQRNINHYPNKRNGANAKPNNNCLNIATNRKLNVPGTSISNITSTQNNYNVNVPNTHSKIANNNFKYDISNHKPIHFIPNQNQPNIQFKDKPINKSSMQNDNFSELTNSKTRSLRNNKIHSAPNSSHIDNIDINRHPIDAIRLSVPITPVTIQPIVSKPITPVIRQPIIPKPITPVIRQPIIPKPITPVIRQSIIPTPPFIYKPIAPILSVQTVLTLGGGANFGNCIYPIQSSGIESIRRHSSERRNSDSSRNRLDILTSSQRSQTHYPQIHDSNTEYLVSSISEKTTFTKRLKNIFVALFFCWRPGRIED